MSIVKTELVTSLKRHATKILADLHTSKEAVLITEHGKPSAYLVDVEEYEFTKERITVLEAIAKGESDISEGRTTDHTEARKKFEKWLS